MGSSQSNEDRRPSDSTETALVLDGSCPVMQNSLHSSHHSMKFKWSARFFRSRHSQCSITLKPSEIRKPYRKASLFPRFSRTSVKRGRKGRRIYGKSRAIITEDNSKRQHMKGMKLRRRLKNLTKEQLSDLILEVASTNPQIEKEFHEVCPQPDIIIIKSHLLQLLDCIYKAFPKYHIGSMRDDFCFEMVVANITQFKNECLKYCDDFHKDGLMETVVEYTLMAWPIANRLPEWNNDESNTMKRSILHRVVTKLRLAMRAISMKKEVWMALKDRIEEAVKLDRSIMPALEDIEKILDSLE